MPEWRVATTSGILGNLLSNIISYSTTLFPFALIPVFVPAWVFSLSSSKLLHYWKWQWIFINNYNLKSSNLGVQIRKLSTKLFSCDATVGTKDSVSQTYSISDLGFIKTPLWAVQSSNWLNAQITNITKDSISITFYNPSERGIAGTAAWIQLIFFEPK